MTAQVGDRIIWEGKLRIVLGELLVPANHPQIRERQLTLPVAPPAPGDPIEIWRTSACWRGHVATWEARDAELFLVGVEGNLELTGGLPIRATWVSRVLRVRDGALIQYRHSGWESAYEAVIEVDVQGGAVRRSRRLVAPGDTTKSGPGGLPERVDDETPFWGAWPMFIVGISAASAAWETLPEWSEAFAGSPSRESWPVPSMDDAPDPRRFRDRALRARISSERMRRDLRPGQMATAVGLRPQKGGRLVEWERGDATLDAARVATICAALGVSEAEVGQLRAQDVVDYDRAWDAWADAPMVPAIEVGRACYAVPADFRGARAAVTWACRCAEIAWRPVVLTLDRRTRVLIDDMGNVLERQSRKPDFVPA